MDRERHGLPRSAASRVLLFATISSLVVVAVASALITSVFSSAAPPLVGSAHSAAPSAAGKPLTIAVARTAGGPSEWRAYARAIQRMSEATGRPMRVRYAMTRAEVVGLVESSEVDAGFLCTNCYLELADQPGVSLVAAPRIAGESMDAAVLVVRASSSYTSLGDLGGHRVGVIEPDSLGGHTYLYWLAKQENIDVSRSMVVVCGDSQEQNIKALLAGELEATVVNRSQLALWDCESLTIISSSPEFGMPPFVAGSTVDTATRAAMKQALLGIDPSSGEKGSLVQGFRDVAEADYGFARELSRFSTELRASE